MKNDEFRFDLINTLVPGKLIREKRMTGSGKVMIDFISNSSASINVFFVTINLFPEPFSLCNWVITLLYCCLRYLDSAMTFCSPLGDVLPFPCETYEI